MVWTVEDSVTRAGKAWADTEGVVVCDLVREAEFENTTLKRPRRVTAAHVYVDVPGFRALITGADALPDVAVARQLHLWGREITRVVERDFDAAKVHFQGPRLHAVVYRPVGDQAIVAVRAVLLAAAVRATARAFNDVLGLVGAARWRTAAGTAHGTALLTKNGSSGDRELLFLGTPANQAAKILRTTHLRVDGSLAVLLDDDLRGHLVEPDTGEPPAQVSQDEVYSLTVTDAELEELCAKHGIPWTVAGCSTRVAADDEGINELTVVTSRGDIDKSRLGVSHTKSAFGVSLFADVDGFTQHIKDADAAGTLDNAVREFHVIRLETRHTLVQDYAALRVQYQGDRVQALIHQPVGDPNAVAVKAVRAAAAVTSVFAHTLPDVLGDTGLQVAIGLAAGDVLVSKLGERGNRDVVCLGASTAEAARIQEALDGEQIGVDSTLYALLPDWLQAAFSWHPNVKAYVAEELTLDQLDQLEASDTEDPAATLLAGARTTSMRPAVTVPTLRPYCRAAQ